MVLERLGRSTLVAVLLGAATGACGGRTFDTAPSDGGTTQDGPSRFDARPGPDGCVLTPEWPRVTVTDGTTGLAICDAELVNAGKGISLTACTGSDGCASSCGNYLAIDTAENDETFRITVTAPGYEAITRGELAEYGCGCGEKCPVETITVALSPLASNPPPPEDGGFPDDAGFFDASPPPTPDASAPECPANAPNFGDPCSEPTDLFCEYGSSPDPSCNQIYECEGGNWTEPFDTSDCVDPGKMCPTYAVADSGAACADNGQVCAYPQGTCECTTDPGGLPLVGGPIWACTPVMPGCPAARPTLGSACSEDATKVCDYGACNGNFAEDCVGGHWSVANTACAD